MFYYHYSIYNKCSLVLQCSDYKSNSLISFSNTLLKFSLFYFPSASWQTPNRCISSLSYIPHPSCLCLCIFYYVNLEYVLPPFSSLSPLSLGPNSSPNHSKGIFLKELPADSSSLFIYIALIGYITWFIINHRIYSNLLNEERISSYNILQKRSSTYLRLKNLSIRQFAILREQLTTLSKCSLYENQMWLC